MIAVNVGEPPNPQKSMADHLNLYFKQDGKPYILSVEASRPVNDPRTQGFNVLAQTTFSSLEDVKYYDEKCEAHASLKAFAKEKVAGPPMVVMWETS
jgi:hypothetical protein